MLLAMCSKQSVSVCIHCRLLLLHYGKPAAVKLLHFMVSCLPERRELYPVIAKASLQNRHMVHFLDQYHPDTRHEALCSWYGMAGLPARSRKNTAALLMVTTANVL